MLKNLFGFAVLCLTLNCSSSVTVEEGTDTLSLTPDRAAELIREHADFRQPIEIEIPADSRGPAVQALASQGYLAIPDASDGNATLTTKAHNAGAHEGWFESNIPLYYIPVGGYELQRIGSIDEVSRSEGTMVVRFVYRAASNELGAELRGSGSNLQQLADSGAGAGRALVVRSGDRWEVKLMELNGVGSAQS